MYVTLVFYLVGTFSSFYLMLSQLARETSRLIVPKSIENDLINVILKQMKSITSVNRELFTVMFIFNLILFMFSFSFSIFLLFAIKKHKKREIILAVA